MNWIMRRAFANLETSKVPRIVMIGDYSDSIRYSVCPLVKACGDPLGKELLPVDIKFVVQKL